MGRYPFTDSACEYMNTMKGQLADTTWDALSRRYRRMGSDLVDLYGSKEIKTTSPKNLTPDDVRVYLLYRKSKDLSQKEIGHDITALKNLLQYNDNPAVDLCLFKNPMLRPRSRGKRLPPLSNNVYKEMLERSTKVEGYRMVRAYALVLFAIRTGMRTKEIRFSEIDDLDMESYPWLMSITHVKGEDSYGEARTVPVHPDVYPIMRKYLELRKTWLESNDLRSRALFPSMDSDDGYLSGNRLRSIKKIVEDDLGVEFQLRTCRRTYGQLLSDDSVDIESISVSMGHHSTKTTGGTTAGRTSRKRSRR